MRTKLLFLVFCLFFKIALSQTYWVAFDKSEYKDNYGNSQSFCSNTCDALRGAGSVMDAYYKMYLATKDIHYLDKLIIYAKRVKERRDGGKEGGVT